MSTTPDKENGLQIDGWPSWVCQPNSRYDIWFISRVLVPLQQKIKSSYALYTPSQLLLDLDNFAITGLTHYKRNEDWYHEFVRVDIKLNTSGPTLPMSTLSMIYERTFHDNGKPVMEVILTNPQAFDNITFLLEEEADQFIREEAKGFELSRTQVDLDSCFFSIIILGFILESHSSESPEYDIISKMCYWYAGSTLDCLDFVLSKARHEAPSSVLWISNCPNNNKAGTFKFLFWDISWFKRGLSYWTREPEPPSAPQTDGSLTAKTANDAEIRAQRFRVCNMLGLQLRELHEKSLEEQDNILRQHLVMERPFIIKRRKGCYVLHPIQLPAYLLLQESFVRDEITLSSAEAPAHPAKAFVQKARELFYGQNKFLVGLEALPLFFCGRAWARTEQADIAPLIRNMTIIIMAPDSTDGPTGQSDDDVQQYKLYRDFKRVSQEWYQKRLDILKDLDKQAKIEVLLLAGRGEQAWPAINCLRQDIAPKLVELGERFSHLRVQEGVTDDGSEWGLV